MLIKRRQIGRRPSIRPLSSPTCRTEPNSPITSSPMPSPRVPSLPPAWGHVLEGGGAGHASAVPRSGLGRPQLCCAAPRGLPWEIEMTFLSRREMSLFCDRNTEYLFKLLPTQETHTLTKGLLSQHKQKSVLLVICTVKHTPIPHTREPARGTSFTH